MNTRTYGQGDKDSASKTAHLGSVPRNPFRWSFGKGFLLLAVLIVSIGLLYYASWIYAIEVANVDFEHGDYEQALVAYRAAEHKLLSRWGWLPGLRSPMQQALVKQVQILYRNGNFEEGLELLERMGTEYPFLEGVSQYHLWYGNVLCRRTVLQKDMQALLDGLRAALREYQKALELDGDSWDARYNFELLKRTLTSETQSDPEQLDLLLKEIRENTRRDTQDKLPPEKRS